MGDDSNSLTITDKKGQIVFIDAWDNEAKSMTKSRVMNGLESSGISSPKGFWESL